MRLLGRKVAQSKFVEPEATLAISTGAAGGKALRTREGRKRNEYKKAVPAAPRHIHQTATKTSSKPATAPTAQKSSEWKNVTSEMHRRRQHQEVEQNNKTVYYSTIVRTPSFRSITRTELFVSPSDEKIEARLPRNVHLRLSSSGAKQQHQVAKSVLKKSIVKEPQRVKTVKKKHNNNMPPPAPKNLVQPDNQPNQKRKVKTLQPQVKGPRPLHTNPTSAAKKVVKPTNNTNKAVQVSSVEKSIPDNVQETAKSFVASKREKNQVETSSFDRSSKTINANSHDNTLVAVDNDKNLAPNENNQQLEDTSEPIMVTNNKESPLVVDTSASPGANGTWTWGFVRTPATLPHAVESEESKRLRHQKWLECAHKAIYEAKNGIANQAKNSRQQVPDDDEGNCEDESTEDDTRSISSIDLLIRCIGNCGDAEAGDPVPLSSEAAKLKLHASAQASNSIVEPPRQVVQRRRRRR